MRYIFALLFLSSVFSYTVDYYRLEESGIVVTNLIKMLNGSENMFEIKNDFYRFSAEASSGLLNVQCYKDKILLNICFLKPVCTFIHKNRYPHNPMYTYIIDVISPSNDTIVHCNGHTGRRSFISRPYKTSFFGKKGLDNYQIASKATNVSISSSTGLLNITCYEDKNVVSECLMKNKCTFLHEFSFNDSITSLDPVDKRKSYNYKVNVVSMDNNTIISYEFSSNYEESHRYLVNLSSSIMTSGLYIFLSCGYISEFLVYLIDLICCKIC